MDNSSPRRQHRQLAVVPRGFLVGLLIIGNSIKWLARLVMPTPQDLIDAEVYLD